MNKRRFIKASLWMTALSPFFLASCVDNDYDLSKDVDMNVTVGGDLTIPGSGTEEITLEEIMDLEDNSVLKADEQGNYALNKADTTETDVEIDPVHISSTPSSTTTTLNFDSPASTSQEVQAAVEDVTTHFDFSNENVTTDIVEIKSAGVDFPASLTLSFSPTPNSQDVNDITLKKGFTIEMRLENQTEADALVFELGDTENYGIKDGAAQTIEFKKDQKIKKGTTLEVPITFKRIQNFPSGQGLYEPGHFRLHTDIIANGTATTAGIPSGNIQVDLHTGSKMPETITLQSVTGIIDPEIDINVDPIIVEGIPDFLQDEINLDLTNPYIKLRLENGSPADVNLKAKVTWIENGTAKDGFQIGTEATEAEGNTGQAIILGRNATTEYYLSRVAMPASDLPGNAKNIVLGDSLYELVRHIPEEINLADVEAKALPHETEVELGENGARYDMNTIYELNAPLQLGDSLEIVYKDTINGWNIDFDNSITVDSAFLEMTATNGLPLDFEVNAKAIDRNGNDYPDITFVPELNKIPAGLKMHGEEGGTQCPVRLRIVADKGILKDLDGLVVTFKANSEDTYKGVTLNKGMTLTLTGIRIRIVNGISADLN